MALELVGKRPVYFLKGAYMHVIEKRFFWLENCPYNEPYDWSYWAADAWYKEHWTSKIIIKITDGV